MDLEPQIIEAEEKKIVGISMEMSIVSNLTSLLWGQFGPRIKEITNRISTEKISLQVYPTNYFKSFNPQMTFIKWAAVEVGNENETPKGLERLVIPKGLYARFHYIGRANDPSIFQFIYENWVPKSDFELDDRPHFEVLSDNYSNSDPDSEEMIWIPIKVPNSTSAMPSTS